MKEIALSPENWEAVRRRVGAPEEAWQEFWAKRSGALECAIREAAQAAIEQLWARDAEVSFMDYRRIPLFAFRGYREARILLIYREEALLEFVTESTGLPHWRLVRLSDLAEYLIGYNEARARGAPTVYLESRSLGRAITPPNLSDEWIDALVLRDVCWNLRMPWGREWNTPQEIQNLRRARQRT